VLRQRNVWAAFAGVAVIGLSWYVALLCFVPGAYESFRDALFLPLGDQDRHSGSAHFHPPWWYLGVLPVRAAPASLLLPFVVWRLWRTRFYRDDPRRRFAALAFLVPFLAFSVLPQKQKHYTLSMLPGLALCSADAVLAAGRELRGRFSLVLRGAGTLVALAGLGVTVLFALFFNWVESLEPLRVAALVGLPLAGFALACLAAGFARPASFGASWVIAFLLLLALGRGVIEPRLVELARDLTSLPLEDQERLARISNEHPWFATLLFQALDARDDD
jgi:4-amino-4-deoxy-L-arabinose transferase-like glycosyltransferase